MSMIFYDHLLDMQNVARYISEICESEEEKLELWNIVDEIVHHRVLGCILDNLPREHHEDFIERFKSKPHSRKLIVFINNRIGHDIEGEIRENTQNLQEELLKELAG
ncbi:hypothetical protein JXA63_02205 [Candidatus Woesebacteria bacterium]|nr:hypothetical protein [Candidatus Woesebacteria bacterium]